MHYLLNKIICFFFGHVGMFPYSDPSIKIQRTKTIVCTPHNFRYGTVKEFISDSGYNINISGEINKCERCGFTHGISIDSSGILSINIGSLKQVFA